MIEKISKENLFMKYKKSIKQKIAEISYKKPSLGKKMSTIEKSFKEVNDIINGKKK